ncbi:protein madd-4 isoform X2 [Teleopsis dalmanni]|uniref:protein madd-4 isoform X2 n=1 Tax=Teleopsis dalmanni TaxID=139649 RepID=UPI0018CF45E8|nr:protein madd-4 isoform X2 [Teleopsis dalmanni]
MEIKIMDSKFSFWSIVFLLTILIQYGSAARKLNASQAFDNTWNTASDLENELEQKRAKGSTAAAFAGGGGGQWSGWSEWSTCSRTCDGGIMQQIRRCNNINGCKGENVRYRICNMQPCPDQQDFRAHQCAAYNDVPYDGTLYKWTPHYDYIEPCALTCRGRPAHLTDDISPETEGSEDAEHYDEPNVIVQLSTRVQDGTRCRSGSLDMCIQGKCQRVGCDLKISSTKKIDGCGVCGGDGSSCSQTLYNWESAPMSLCSVSCGGGYKMSRPVCRSRVTGTDVEDSLCNPLSQPEPSVVFCNTHTCPPRWIADEWSACSRLCGPGYRERIVVCAEENNGMKTRVSDVMCKTAKPPAQEQCIVQECPKWEAEEWSGCSVSCGHGIQMRGVECKSVDGSLSAKCDPNTKPAGVQQCATGISCEGGSVTGGQIIIGSSNPISTNNEQFGDSSAIDDSDEEDDNDAEDVDMDENESGGAEDTETISYNDQPPLYAQHSVNRLYHDEMSEPKTQRLTSNGRGSYKENSEPLQPSADPTFIKETEWSPCSVTCGEGIRRRPYKCKIFLEYSRTIATVNDTLCDGPKPHDEVERCVEDPCMLPSHSFDDQYPRDSIKVGVSEPGKTYVWREQGYTSCSASCLGGVEELIINCVREDNGRVVSPFLCSPEAKPESRVRTCNDRPCPPRWNYSDYTPCSKSCGFGIKTREVQCIHEVTRGGENTMVVPNSMCPQPPPADRQYCNVLDCPVRWEVGEWSKCSHTCGFGIKERKVECKQIMAQEHKIERPETMCPSAKPPDKKPCNVKSCPPEDPKPVISISNTTHIQHDPKKSKITLKVGGAGVVFFGTQVKIKCPVKRYNRTKIKWNKDHKPLARSRKFKISKKGALRILDITFRDAGIYSCHAGLSSAEIHIEVKAKPGQQVTDLERQESDRLVRERSGTEPLTSADMTAIEGNNSSQTSRRKQHNNGRERNRRPKSGEVQHADSSIMEDEQSQLVQQAQDSMLQFPNASSGGSRRTNALLAMPYFQALLSNLQKFSSNNNLRGQHLLHDKGLQFGIDFEGFEQDEPAKPQIITKTITTLPSNEHDDAAASDIIAKSQHTHTLTQSQNLPQSPHARWQGHWSDSHVADSTATKMEQIITYKWVPSDWTECTQKCGTTGTGLKHRSITCVRLLEPAHTNDAINIDEQTKYEIVDNTNCESYGLSTPDTIETCGNQECPQWIAGEWTSCSQSRCLGRNIAVQKREVNCEYANYTEADGCDEYNKPIIRQECFSERCKGVWRVEPWSECNAPCNRQGIKYRILQCVWYGTRRPAGNACKHQPRPAVMKVCKSPSCIAKSSTSICIDTSRYCRNVRSMGLCRLHRYQEKCCKSCKIHLFK